jgi:hypothetical protein
MSNTDAWYAGYHQSDRSEDLFEYQTSKGYNSQTSDAASDMEPSWDGELITKQLVNGDAAQGWALYYDFGSADGCPQSGSSDGPCNNGWHASDVGYVSFHGLAMSLPEIYYSVLANQWTVVRKLWNGAGDYYFAGVIGVDRRRTDTGSEVEHSQLAEQRPGRFEIACSAAEREEGCLGARGLAVAAEAAWQSPLRLAAASPPTRLRRSRVSSRSPPPTRTRSRLRLPTRRRTRSRPGCSVPTFPCRSRRHCGCGTAGS